MKTMGITALALLIGAASLAAAASKPHPIPPVRGHKLPAFTRAAVSMPKLQGIARVECDSRWFGHNAAIDRPLTDGAPAYDYSVHMLWDTRNGFYRMYTGGRWLRRGVPFADGDHVLQHRSKTGSPFTWYMPKNEPEFYFPAEMGHPDVWDASNCLEAEVMRVGDTWYMYAQIQGMPGPSLPGELEPRDVDRIVLFTSPDGDTWTRASRVRGVVVNLDEPETTALHHQEVIYVPWDPDGRPFWMYVGVNRKGAFTGYYRIRSADPTTFDWRMNDGRAYLAQLGNQIGYIRNVKGAPLFLRITFTSHPDGRSVPSLQFSRDGLQWEFGADGPVLLQGSTHPDTYKNCYFLGFSTIDGTGELQQIGPNTWRTLYGATCAATPVAPEIFHSEIGLGELKITVR